MTQRALLEGRNPAPPWHWHGLQSPEKLEKGSLGDFEVNLSGFLEVGFVGTEGIRYPRKMTGLQALRPLPIPLRGSLQP